MGGARPFVFMPIGTFCCTDLFIKEALPIPLLLWEEVPGVPMAEFILDGCSVGSLVSC